MAAIVDSSSYAAYSDSYSSASSAPRTPSPHHYDPYPAVFSPDNMHSDYPQQQQQQWNQEPFPYDHREPYDATKDPYPTAQDQSYPSKLAPREPPPSQHEHAPGAAPGGPPPSRDNPSNVRRATFPFARHDRERDELPPMNAYPGFMSSPHHPHQHPPPPVPGNGMYGPEHDYPHPPPPSGSPHPPYHHHPDYDHHQQSYYRPHPSHHYGHPMPLPPMHHPHHPHGLSMTYISPHTGLPVQHTDDAASKETQYLRRRCFNCHTTEPPSWRRSTLNPGKIVCNKCGLYERTHLRPRPLRFDELRAGNKARKAGGPGAKGGKKGAVAPANPPVTSNVAAPPADEGLVATKEPREFYPVRRSSVSSSGSSNNINSDWDSSYSSSNAPTSGPSTTYSSPASSHYPLPRDSSNSPGADGIRLPPAPMSDIGSSHHGSPLISHQSPHLTSTTTNGSPQLLHHSPLVNRSPPPPRKAHTSPYPHNGLGNGHYREMNGSSHSLHSANGGDISNGSPVPLAAASPAGSS